MICHNNFIRLNIRDW